MDPGSIVKRAKRIQDKERLKHDKYDQVFCVFDRDEHATFATACNEARSSGFSPVCSWPCFEYWILLHFRYSRSPYGRTGDKSPADNCISDLMQVFPEYKKSIPEPFRQLEHLLQRAMKHALRAKKDAEQTGEPNPSTDMHVMVDYLLSQLDE